MPPDNAPRKKWYLKKERAEIFFGSQREIVLEGILDLEQASCADRCFFK